MNTLGHEASSKCDDELLTIVSSDICEAVKNKYITKLPSEWNIICSSKKLTFKDIMDRMIDNGVSVSKAKTYYGTNTSIDTDANIIYLTMNKNGVVVKYPIFFGEMKKQGTNDKRIAEGLDKQSIGNAACDRVWKNYKIAADYSYLCDREFFPYNVFMHGCDFDESTISDTIKGKLQPMFGNLNVMNPFFDKDVYWERKGGSCFYQKYDFTYDQLFDKCYTCCEIGINHYLEKYAK